MKTALFARPNIKLMMVFALGLLVIQHFLTVREAAAFQVAESYEPGGASWEQIDRLVAQSLERPSVEQYLRISECYRQRGDTEQAMRYLRKARLAAELEEQ